MDTQAIRNAIAAAGLTGTAEQVHAALVAPHSSGTKPITMSMAGVASVISQSARFALLEHPRFEAIEARIDAQDRAKVAAWAVFLREKGVLSDADVTAVNAYLAATEADTRSIAERAGLSGVGVENVRRAMMGD